MNFDFNPWELSKKGFCIVILIILFSILLHFFTNFIKSKDSICDSEKQSKFILECIKEDKTKTVRTIGRCERVSIGLYCK